jgi:hypothetical protein
MVWDLLWQSRDGSRDMEIRHTLGDALELVYRYLREGQDIVEIGEVGKTAAISGNEIKHLFGPAALAKSRPGIASEPLEHADGLAPYQVYFRGSAGICDSEQFRAEGDGTAVIIAELLADTRSHRCLGFELWRGNRQVCIRRIPPRPSA